MIEPTQADLGRPVAYRPRPQAPTEYGVLVGYNERYVIVRFEGCSAPMATPYHRLIWDGPRVERAPPSGQD